MNNRRSFFKSLIGLIVAPKVAEALPVAKPKAPVSFNKVMIPMIRRVYPELLAKDIVGVQPMSGPVGLAFAHSYHNDTKGELV